jgi:hypothetical protein
VRALRHNSLSDQSPAAHDAGVAGFVPWIILYAVLLVALIAVNGGTQLFSYDHLGWML